MKQLILIAIIIISGFKLQAQPDSGIKFEHGTFAEIKNKAKAEKKNIFIDCYTVWCGPCKKLNSDVFPNKEVGNYFNANFINYKVDMEKGEGIELQKKFNVGAFPTLLFVNSEGEIIHRVLGFVDAKKLVEEAQKAPSMANNISEIERNYINNNTDPQVVKTFLSYLVRGGDTRVDEVANHYFSLLPEDQYIGKENFNIIKSVVRDPFAPVIIYMVNNKDKFIEKYGESSVNAALISTYYQKASNLSMEVKDGLPFNEEEFQKLIAVMKERNFDDADQVIFNTRLKVLGYQKKWAEYMEMMEKKYDEIGRDSLNYSRDIYAYLADIAYGCTDKEILSRVYDYYDNAVNYTDGFVMHEFVSMWITKEVIMKKMDNPEELEIIQNQLGVLKILNNKYNEARKAGKLN
jgi:thioredoxin-related protein